MPHVNGYELIKRDRTFKPALPAIIMNGDFGRFPRPEPDLSEVKRLEKPIYLAELLKALPKRVR